MTPGQHADRALTLVNQASGSLGYMVIKRKLQRWRLAEVVRKLESALADLKRATGEDL